jgi:hypothetical protein
MFFQSVWSLLFGDTPGGTHYDKLALRLVGTLDGILPDPTILHAQLLVDVQTIRAIAPNLHRTTNLTMDRSEH